MRLAFTPRSFISNKNKQDYLVYGYIVIDVDDNGDFVNPIHSGIYEALKPYGTWEEVIEE